MKNKIFRVSVFIDGFNLYHFLAKNRHRRKYKWLDLEKLSSLFLPPSAKITTIHYFTAFAYWRKDKVKRHKDYIKALSTKNINIVIGRFKKVEKTILCNNGKIYKGITREEKETDVSIGVGMVEAAFKDEFDICMLISGDTDFEPAIKSIKSNFPDKQIHIVVPEKGVANSLVNLSDRWSRIKEKHLKSSQLKSTIRLPNGINIHKPASW